MKTIFRFLGLSVLAAGFVVAGNTTGFAQDACADVDGQTALYKSFTDNYPKTDIASQEAAVSAGKQFLEKYGKCDTVAEQNKYFTDVIPKMEAALAKRKEGAAVGEILKRFDDAVKASKWDDAYAAGNEFVTKYPDHPAAINLIVTMGQIGYAESFPPKKNYKYNNDTLRYAKMAIDKINAGAQPKKGGAYGAFQFECANKDECISQLTYDQAFITYYGQDNKQAALPIFYQVTQLPGSAKNNPALYGTLGDYYFIDVKRLADEVQTKIKALQAAPDADKPAKDAEVKAAIAQLNGYAERALDYYSRAYKLTKDTPESAAYKTGIYNQIQGIYNVRTGKSEKSLVDAYIAQSVTKPLPDPTSPVTPISDPEPTKDASTSTGGATSTSTPATTAPASTKPATPAKPTTTPTKPASVNNGTATAKKTGGATAATKPAASPRKPGSN